MGEPFITDCTVALLLSGWGKPDIDLPAINRNREAIEEILLECCKMTGVDFVVNPSHHTERKMKLFTVESSGATRSELLMKLKNIKNILEQEQGNFLFYFTGHNWPNKESLQIDYARTRDDFLKYEELKQELSEVKSKHKLFILDTCCSGAVALKEGHEILPLLWDVALEDEEDETKVQWYSSAKDQDSFLGYEIGFTTSIKEVLSDPNCKLKKCIDLRKEVPSGGMARLDQIHPCVVDHLQGLNQTPELKCSNGNENMKNFPALACRK